jgi:hypothetical protein
VDSDFVYQLIGYAGSALIVLSLMQQSILRLRIVGLVGSLVFLVYSLLIGAYPIAVVNVIAMGIHIYNLRRLTRHKAEVFTVLRVLPESKMLGHFLDFHGADITARLGHEFRYERHPDQLAAFVLRDMVPAGLFVGSVHDDHSVEVQLDYVVPQYRDFKIGEFLYSRESGLFEDPACRVAWATPESDEHAQYLERMGFRSQPTPESPTRRAIDLTELA